jgi:hypothetical protein
MITRLLPCLMVLLAGCSSAAAPQQFVGSVFHSDVVVGLVEHGGHLGLYASGGPTTYQADSRWFTGAVGADGHFSLSKDGWTAAGAITGTSVLGTFTTPGGASLLWNASAVADGTAQGVFGATDSGCSAGVVVSPGDSGVNVQGTWCSSDGHAAPLTPVHPEDVKAGGFNVQANGPSGLRTFFVSPAVTFLGD